MRGLFRRLLRRRPPGGRGTAAPTRYRPEPRHPLHVQIVGRQSIDLLTARDVSLAGIGVYVPHRFEGCDIDSEVELVITLPGQRPFLARGQIRHRTASAEGDAHFGVEFTSLSDASRERLARYLEGDLVQRVERKRPAAGAL